MSGQRFEVIEGGQGKAGKVLDFELTLKQLAEVEVPEGLAERVKLRLAKADWTGPDLMGRGELIAWPVQASFGARLAKKAAAAAILIVVGGGSWVVYSSANAALEAARNGQKPVVAPSALPSGIPSAGSGGFNTAGAMKKVDPLTAPVVKKQGLGTREQGTGK